MNSDRMMAAGAMAMALMLGGCASTWSPSMGELDEADFGEANRQTFAAMIVNPEPVYTEEMTTSGDHAQQAVERYRTDQVKQPERVSTAGEDDGGGAPQ